MTGKHPADVARDTAIRSIRRTKGSIEVSINPRVFEGSALTSYWFLRSVEASYRYMGVEMRFDEPAARWLTLEEATCVALEARLTVGQQILRDGVLTMVRSPASSDLEANWQILVRLTELLASDRLLPAPEARLQFSVRHGGGKAFRLLTIRTDLAGLYGEEVAGNVTAALVAAVSRAEGKEVRVSDAMHGVIRASVGGRLPSVEDLRIYQAFRDWLIRCDVAECRARFGEIIALTQFFERLQAG